MNQFFSRFRLLLCCAILAAACINSYARVANAQVPTPALVKVQNADGSWGIRVDNAGKASATQPYPIRIDLYEPDYFGDGYQDETPTVLTWGYTTTTNISGGFSGSRSVSPIAGVTINVTDYWTFSGGVVTSVRNLSVSGSSSAKTFMSAIVLNITASATRSATKYFVPGMIYGDTGGLEAAAIGGSTTYGAGYNGIVRIREDRIPAPMFGLRFDDNSSITLLNKLPQGGTIGADGDDELGDKLVDTRLLFGALGVEQPPSINQVKIGYWFPGTEGEVTYANNPSFNGPQHRWRSRLHPLNNGLQHNYTLQWRFASDASQDAFQKAAWRHAWATLNPQVTTYNIETVRNTLVDFMSNKVLTDGGRSGWTNLWNIRSGNEVAWWERRAYLGFIGKNLENAEYLLREAQRRGGADATRFRNLANLVINTQLTIDQSPPSSEGIKLNNGALVTYPTDNVAYLRPLTDDMNALLRAYQFELANSRPHPTWLAWAKDYADWLLTKQGADGSFPRAWNTGSSNKGTVYDASKNSSYLPVLMLLRLNQITNTLSYKTAAINAGNFAWTNYVNNGGHFIGGTPDHANVMDHEGAGLALDAYLGLYEATNDTVWLDRAKIAGDVTETWYYIWNVPMPVDENDNDLQFKRNVPTVGLNVITTGQSGVDYYAAHEVEAFAKLFKYTNDTHYRDVARLLLHNTKSMLALPGRVYDMAGPGWQQEFWSISVPRGYGEVNFWQPWISAAHLHGIYQTEALDPVLFSQLAAIN